MMHNNARSVKRILPHTLLLCSVLAVSSCSWFSKKEVKAKVPCPHVAVISDADLYFKFKPQEEWRRDTILYEAQITRIRSACDYLSSLKKTGKDTKQDGKNKGGPKTLLAALTLSFSARINPAHQGRDVTLDYFVAITDRNENILNKKSFRVKAPKPKVEKKPKTKHATAVAFNDKPVTLEIPLKGKESGHDYMIFAGFQLTPALLDLNRKRRRTPEELGIPDPEANESGSAN